MPDDKYLTVDLPDSSGGVNTRMNEIEISPNELTIAYNLDISTLGVTKKRLGMLSVLNDLSDYPIIGLNILLVQGELIQGCALLII